MHLPDSSLRRSGVCLSLLVLAVGLATAGCADNKHLAIKGTVELRGTRLTAGMLKFHGPGDHLSMAYIQPDGTFTITDVVAGEVKVTVETAPAGGGITPVAIPGHYRSTSTSGLVYTITSKTRNLDIHLD
jgi:hypothetical protein